MNVATMSKLTRNSWIRTTVTYCVATVMAIGVFGVMALVSRQPVGVNAGVAGIIAGLLHFVFTSRASFFMEPEHYRYRQRLVQAAITPPTPLPQTASTKRHARRQATELVERWSQLTAATSFLPGALAGSVVPVAMLPHLVRNLAAIYGVQLDQAELSKLLASAAHPFFGSAVAGLIPMAWGVRHTVTVAMLKRAGDVIIEDLEKQSSLPE